MFQPDIAVETSNREAEFSASHTGFVEPLDKPAGGSQVNLVPTIY